MSPLGVQKVHCIYVYFAYVDMCLYVYAYMYICRYVYMYIYVCLHMCVYRSILLCYFHFLVTQQKWSKSV